MTEERRKLMLQGGPEEIMAKLAGFIGKAGFATFECGYHVDGDDPDREPDAGEEVTWYAEVTYPHGAGTERQELRSSDHSKAMVEVTCDLLVKLGANVAILDARES
jgi:hypothetical protein